MEVEEDKIIDHIIIDKEIIEIIDREDIIEEDTTIIIVIKIDFIHYN